MTRKVGKIQEAIWQIESMEPWPFLETAVLLNFDGDVGVPINMPTDFRATLRLRNVNKQYRVRIQSLDDADSIIGTDEDAVGDPQIYYFEGNDLKVWPIPPPTTGLLRLRYLRWSDDIDENSVDSDILIPKYYHEAIVLKALVALNALEDDTDLAVAFENLFEDKINRMRASIWQRQFDQSAIIHSVDPEEWDYESV